MLVHPDPLSSVIVVVERLLFSFISPLYFSVVHVWLTQLMSYGSGAMIQIVKSRMKGIYHGDISLKCLTILLLSLLLLSLITAVYTVGSG